MKAILIGIIMIFSLSIPADASEITAPEVPKSGYAYMPKNTNSFSDALLELIQNGIQRIHPELENALKITSELIFFGFLCSVLPILSEKMAAPVELAGTAGISIALLEHTNTMIGYAANTVRDICEYGKLLCPVLTTALAAQGGITSSAALFAGTTGFISLLSVLVSRCFVPIIYIFLTFSITNSAFCDHGLKKVSEAAKNILHWLLKTLLIVFTTYMSITGVVSGITDAAALKAAKLTMSTVVPVVGSILSDASESVLVSMGIIKNAAGIYGILATLAVFMGPFIKVGIQYLLLKISAWICSLFTSKNISGLIEDFSTAMGLLLAMVAVSCVMVFISTICFMKGIG